MGRDNTPRKRQERKLQYRKEATRTSYDRILIVSEGAKTEPQYFDEIRRELRLPVRNVTVSPSGFGTDPLSVVNYAEHLFQKGDSNKEIDKRAFERVYAVFDRDDHATYHNALVKADSLNGRMLNDLRKPVEFTAIASVPDFELWLLLHFDDIHQPTRRDEVLGRLKARIPNYEKGMVGTYSATRDRLEDALKRAAILAARNDAYNGEEPYTAISNLVLVLHKMKR